MATDYASAQIMPEAPVWAEGIYQIETTDPVLGYDPAKDDGTYYEAMLENQGYAYGPSNTQWKQLADRTQWLRKMLLVGHDEEGRHHLTDDDFVTDAAIPESVLELDYGTQALLDEITALTAEIRKTYDEIDASEAANRLGLSWALQKLISMTWDRFGDKSAFEMFTDSLKMRLDGEYKVEKAVVDNDSDVGDDSIDVSDSEGMEAGDWYVLVDNHTGAWKYVCVAAVLDENRILLTEPSPFTTDDGWMRGSNVSIKDFSAVAEGSFAYISKPLAGFNTGDDITITLRHLQPVPELPVVEYLPEGGNEWLPAASVTKSTGTGREDDIAVIPAQEGSFRFRITYSSLPGKTEFTAMSAVARHAYDTIEDVRRPEVLSVSAAGMVAGSPYRSLYEIEQRSMTVQASPYADFSRITGESTKVVPDGQEGLQEITQCQVNTAGAAYVRIKYTDIERVSSRWSAPFAIG